MTLPPLVITRRYLGGRAPAWVATVGGAALVAAGGVLVARPFAALAVLGWYLGLSCVLTGFAELSTRRGDGPVGRAAQVMAAGWVVIGVVIVAWAGRSVAVLVPLVAGALVVSGGLALARLARERGTERWWRASVGIAEIVFGLLAVLWPDATLVVVAILFGARTALVGLALVANAVAARWRGSRPRSTGLRDRHATWPRWVGAGLILLLAGGSAFVSHSFRDGAPVVDAFYDAPDTIPQAPGTLVRWAPYDGDVLPGMTATRLLYVTTDATGAAVLASAVLAVPDAVVAAPLVTWAHGTVGVARACAPSLGPDAVSSTTLPAPDAFVRNGWAVVATDYPGMGTEDPFPYLIGQGEGRAVLDAARAARQVPGADLGDETVVWGHSQGGNAALWAGQLAETYAPDLQVAGTAALSPASDPLALAEGVLADPGSPGASLAVSFVVDAYTRYYPELDVADVVAPSARTIVREAASRCTHQGGTLVTVLAGVAIGRDQPIVDAAALEGPFGTRLAENIPAGPWRAPLLVVHGDADTVVPVSLSDDLSARLCAQSQQLELVRIPGGGHVDVLAPGSPLSERLETWTRERFAGEDVSDTCAAP